MKRALLRQDVVLLGAQGFFLALIVVETASGRVWKALGALGGLGACLLVPAVRENSRIFLSPWIDRSMAAMVFCTIFLGERLGFYETFRWWDLAAHAISGALLCCLAAVLFDQLIQSNPDRNAVLRLAFVLSFSIAMAALWEVVEYLLDQFFDSDAQLGSLDDTMMDIIAHLVGVVLAAAILVPRLGTPSAQVPRRRRRCLRLDPGGRRDRCAPDTDERHRRC